MSKLGLSDFLLSTVKIYEQHRAKFRLAEDNPQEINFLVGKLLQETKGDLSPDLATKTIKGIVESMKSMRLKGELA